MTSYIALLRGINVGGNNMIKMTELKACFEKMGMINVRTYIQSGNVLFESDETNIAKLTEEVEIALSKAFDYVPIVVVRSHKHLKAIVEHAPKGFGQDPAYRYNVLFVKPPVSVAQVMDTIKPKEGVDAAYEGDGVMYFSNLMARATQSRLSMIAGTPVYKNITIRNWNTTTKLLALLNLPE